MGRRAALPGSDKAIREMSAVIAMFLGGFEPGGGRGEDPPLHITRLEIIDEPATGPPVTIDARMRDIGRSLVAWHKKHKGGRG